ncbi:MAG: hypothetical protein ACXVHB_06090 [Solirubrobacteraceae bacterium]
MLTYVLAFVGGGAAEALIAHALHHLVPRKPQRITLDDETRALLGWHRHMEHKAAVAEQRAAMRRARGERVDDLIGEPPR